MRVNCLWARLSVFGSAQVCLGAFEAVWDLSSLPESPRVRLNVSESLRVNSGVHECVGVRSIAFECVWLCLAAFEPLKL